MTTTTTRCEFCGEEHDLLSMRTLVLTDGEGTVLDKTTGCVGCIRGLAVTGSRSDMIEG